MVADEVRKLAEQSQKAAQKIAELIKEIQGDTEKAVAVMNDGTREVKTGAEVVNTAGVAFQKIVGSVKKIEDISKISAVEAQAVSAAAEEQSASMEEITSSSENLANMAQELQEAVAKFRLQRFY